MVYLEHFDGITNFVGFRYVILIFVFSFSVFCSFVAPLLSSFGLFFFLVFHFIDCYFLVVPQGYIIHIPNLSHST